MSRNLLTVVLAFGLGLMLVACSDGVTDDPGLDGDKPSDGDSVAEDGDTMDGDADEPRIDGDKETEPADDESIADGDFDHEVDIDLVPTDGDELVDSDMEIQEEMESSDREAEEAGETEISGCVRGEFLPYQGLIHAHTGYSDGELTPLEAFPYGRDQGGLDFFIITDHLDSYYWKPIPLNKWQRCFDAADQFYAPGTFLPDCGYEDGFSIPFDPYSVGHNNVFYCRDLFSPLEADFRTFYNTLIAHPGAISQYNHPGDDNQNRNDWEYFPLADIQLNLMEFNGDEGLDKTWEYFFAALDKGWHLSPTYNQDNHGADWGTKNDRRTGFFLPDLTREDLHDAMMTKRSIMMLDKNAWIKIVTDEGCWMGSVITGYSHGVLNIEAYDADEGDGFDRIELYGAGQTLQGSFSCENSRTCTWRFEVTPTRPSYYVAKAVQTDGDFLVSAPLWLSP